MPRDFPVAALFTTTLALCALALGAVPVGAQSDPAKVKLVTENRDSIVAALTREAEASGLTFVKADKNKATFTKDAGQMAVRGRMTAITLEVTFHFDKAKPGTQVVPTEELVAGIGAGFEERRKPNPRERAQVYQQILDRTKAALEGGAAAPSDTGGVPAGP
jgi:hypothetical protein